MFLCRVYVVQLLPFTCQEALWGGKGYLQTNELVSHHEHDSINSTMAFGKLGFVTFVALSSKKLYLGPCKETTKKNKGKVVIISKEHGESTQQSNCNGRSLGHSWLGPIQITHCISLYS